jgi:hypothetical protein
MLAANLSAVRLGLGIVMPHWVSARRGGEPSKLVWRACGVSRGAFGLGAAVAWLILWLMLSPAFAACDPASGTAAANNIPAICTGTTVNQGGGAPGTSAGVNGYGNAENLNVTVVPGASVTGTARGIFLSDGTVLNSGSITGGNFGGIRATTANVANSGTITGGAASVGIIATTANVTNSGTITGGQGIFGGSAANVINSGTIRGTGSIGISSSNLANVINSGTITGGADGINASGGTANVSNSGAITGSSRGISTVTVNVTNIGTITGGTSGIGATIANVTNSGTITGGNTGILATTAGILTPTANVINSGTITGGAFGFFLSPGFGGVANVTNSGIITGGTAALQFDVNPDTLTLLPGSKIIGAINLGGGGDTVNVRTGNQNLTFDTLAGATVTSTLPFVVVGNRVVTIDVTPFATAGTTLGDFSRSVAAMVPVFDDLPATTGGAPLAFAPPSAPAPIFSPAFDHIPGLSAYAADTVAFKAPTVTHADGTTFWARGFGGQRIQQADGVVLRNVSNFFGGAMGMDKAVSPNSSSIPVTAKATSASAGSMRVISGARRSCTRRCRAAARATGPRATSTTTWWRAGSRPRRRATTAGTLVPN